ncbi:MAG TPA: zinc-dependent alcohol dehydrogenase family protein [Solirubrobacteraceae bacterium]|nr:zinc-dependent alcohol dehydrogenase family protein [Solirubrobacteraceae bacterium]
MRAIQILGPGRIEQVELAVPTPSPGQLLVRVHACGVCRTDLHLLDGEVAIPRPPVVPGHQIVATVVESGDGGGASLAAGTRVGIPWLGWTCGECRYCNSGAENLCDRARFTGRDIDGGYAEFAVADQRFCFPLPERYSDLEAAPLLCAGLIGFRALRLAGDAERIGLYGFGAAAHIIAQVARSEGRRVFAFTREGDSVTQEFARTLGAEWAGGSLEPPPEELDGALIFAAAGQLVPAALRAVRKGGAVVCAGIHMSEIPAFPYAILWGERVLRSVANLTREDARDFLALAERAPIATAVRAYALAEAPQALEDLRAGRFEGAAVIEL